MISSVLVVSSLFAYSGRHEIKQTAKDIYHQIKNRKNLAQLALLAPPERAESPLVIYQGGLQSGWSDWSWTDHQMSSSGSGDSHPVGIRMSVADNKGLYFHHDSIGTDGYGSVVFSVRGHSRLTISTVTNSAFSAHVKISDYAGAKDPAGFVHYTIPLAKFGVSKPGGAIDGLSIQADGMGAQSAVDVDDIALMPDLSVPLAPTSVTVSIVIDTSHATHAISPLIYGMAFAPPDYMTDLKVSVNRWGGNDKTRYNWKLGNADNAARDWGWRNRFASSGNVPMTPGSAADDFVSQNQSGGAETLLTVPTIGWVARDADNGHFSSGVPNQGGPEVPGTDGAISGYNPAENRQITSVKSMPRRPASGADPDAVYQDDWIRHLKAKFGPGNKGGVAFYAMDNEPDLWDTTHTDVHPAQPGYDDILREFLTYADAVKDVDPTAQVTGPVSWGWTGYYYSPLDRGTDNFHTFQDSLDHGGGPFLPWFLAQVHKHDLRLHRRTLDYLDIHYYPQAQNLYSQAADLETGRRRLRSTDSLWNPNYLDESWIGKPVMLIPRMHKWIASNYPGTKLAITEWNFGADSNINGGLAIADVLGIFGVQGLDMANYWAYPPKGSPGYLAFKLYRNPDGSGHGFGDKSVDCSSSNESQVSAFASMDSKTGDLTLICVNKTTRAEAHVPVVIHGYGGAARIVSAWRMDGAHPKIYQDIREIGLHPGSVTLSPHSVTLYRLAQTGK